MSRIKTTFDRLHQTGHKAFVGFLTAGDPTPAISEEYILTMAEAGADLIEVGIPFSDPTAEGKVIQEANLRALKAGTTTDTVFDLLARVRKTSEVPLVLLTYLNPVFVYGYERFFKRCNAVGIDGIIIPDLPYEERGEVLPFARENGVDLIALIAPTSSDRIAMIAREATGYLYLVSSMGVTGVRQTLTADSQAITAEIKAVTDVPVCVGFGIATPSQAAQMTQHADGVIVGSAIVRLIAEHGERAHDALGAYIRAMKEAIQ